MTLFDNFNQDKTKKLASYLKLVDYTTLSGEEAVSLMLALINSGEYSAVKIIADYFLSNGLPFDRASIVPANIVYSSGEVPLHKLKFTEILFKLYKHYNILSYDTEARAILTRLISYNVISSGSYQTTPLSTDVLLYDENNNLIPDFRSGTHISDIFPASWILYNYETYSDSQIDFIDDSFDYSYITYGYDFVAMPFYVRNLSENNLYGTFDTFSATGSFGDETNSSYQFDITLNVSKYYYEYFKRYGERNLKAKSIIETTLNYISNFTDFYPLSMSLTTLNFGLDNVYFNNASITFGDLSVYTPVIGDIGIGNLAKIGLSCLYNWLIDRNEASLTKCRYIVSYIEGLQTSNGNIFESTINYNNQSLCLQLLSEYNNSIKKTYYQIINESLKTFNLNEINDINAETHPQRFIFSQCNEGIEAILSSKYFEFTETNTLLTHTSGSNSYNISSYEIESGNIKSVEYILGNSLHELNFVRYERYNELITNDSNLNTPQVFTINENTNMLLVHPIPDKDYSICVNHFKLENEITDFNAYPSFLPVQWYPVLKYFLCWKLGINLSHPLADYFKIKYLEWQGKMMLSNERDLSEKNYMPSSINWNGGGHKSFEGYKSRNGVI